MSEEKNKPATAPTGVPIPKSRRGMKGFMQETAAELKKVHWASRQEVTRLTGVVFAVCVGSVLLLFGLSTAFTAVLHFLTTGK